MNTNLSITSSDWLKTASDRLKHQAVPSHYLDSLIMLEDELGISRTKLLTNPNTKLTKKQLIKLENSLERRLLSEPLAYIRGQIEFYGRTFSIQPGVFIPRTESESFIELAKTLDLPDRIKVADLGSGSGCLGITLKLELPNCQVDLIEISKLAVDTSTQNAARLNSKVSITHGDLFNTDGNYDLVMANLPYVPLGMTSGLDIKFEPNLAIYGGKDGLDPYRRLFEQLRQSTKRTNYVITEALPFQHAELAKIASSNNYHLIDTEGLVQAYSKLS